MGKQSKWKDVEFAPGDFASNYSPDFILHVCEVVTNSAKEAMSKGDNETLLSAIRALDFPTLSYNFNYPFNMADDLADVAELLWYRNAPNPTLIKKYAASGNLSEDEAREELIKRCADNLYIHIIHAWRLLDGYFPEKFYSEARHGFINEVAAQTLFETHGSDALPVTKKQLYQIAVSDEEQLRRLRMRVRQGGSETPNYNFRWFPHNYARAYNWFAQATRINPADISSEDSRKRKAWVTEIKAKFTELDEELIARLTGHPDDLTEEHKKKLALKGGDSTPHQIALEQAARWCGLKPYLYTQRGLEKRLESSNRPASGSYTPGLFTFLVNWFGKGQSLTKEEVKDILRLLKVS